MKECYQFVAGKIL